MSLVRPYNRPVAEKVITDNRRARHEYHLLERHEALDVRDPIAIALAAERYSTLRSALAEVPHSETVDLYKPLLSVSQASRTNVSIASRNGAMSAAAGT